MAIGGDDVVKSVGRVFEVLQLFDARRAPLRATDVERALHYPQSSTLALLKSMVRLGYLAFERLDRTYLPTMRVAALGHWLDAAFHGEGRLAALLEDLGESTSETVCLSCQNDLSMQFTQVRLGSQGLILSVRPGDLAPLFQSAIGLTALSARPDAAIRKLAQRMNRQVRGPRAEDRPGSGAAARAAHPRRGPRHGLRPVHAGRRRDRLGAPARERAAPHRAVGRRARRPHPGSRSADRQGRARRGRTLRLVFSCARHGSRAHAPGPGGCGRFATIGAWGRRSPASNAAGSRR